MPPASLAWGEVLTHQHTKNIVLNEQIDCVLIHI
ncbi:MAG: hypothetical protein ACJA13_002442, partial [Paraglaciecola sp.]